MEDACVPLLVVLLVVHPVKMLNPLVTAFFLKWRPERTVVRLCAGTRSTGCSRAGGHDSSGGNGSGGCSSGYLSTA